MTDTKKAVVSTVDPLDELLAQVRAERVSQDERWGEQSHQSYRGETARQQYELMADYYKQIWDAQNADEEIGWDVVLLEEVYEALSELDPEKRKEELIQVAAVALAEIKSIGLRAGILTNAEAVGDVE